MIDLDPKTNAKTLARTITPALTRMSYEALRDPAIEDAKQTKIAKSVDKAKTMVAMKQGAKPLQGSQLDTMDVQIVRPKDGRRRFGRRSMSSPTMPSSTAVNMTSKCRRQSLEKCKSESNLMKSTSSTPTRILSRSNSASRLATAVGCTILSLGEVNGFTPSKVAPNTSFVKASNPHSTANLAASSTSLKAFGIVDGASELASSLSDIGESVVSAATSFLGPAEECSLDGDFLCRDMSMMAESFPAFLKQGDLAIRTGVFVSQLLNLTADLLPGNHITMDSLAYQVITIGITSHGLFKTVQPMIEAAMKKNKQKSISIRDRRAFRDLFAPVGITWSQYNAMSASSMEWITVEPGQAVPSGESKDDCLYYLYQGDMEIHSENDGVNERLYHIERKKHYKVEGAAAAGLVGEETIIKKLHGDAYGPIGNDITVKAGTLGAKLLCIKASKLNSMMHQDNDLSQSMGLLAIQAMQAKLYRQARTQSPMFE